MHGPVSKAFISVHEAFGYSVKYSLENCEIECRNCNLTLLFLHFVHFKEIIMEDSVDVILQDRTMHHAHEKPVIMAASGAALVASYGLWTVFALPGLRKVPTNLKVTSFGTLI